VTEWNVHEKSDDDIIGGVQIISRDIPERNQARLIQIPRLKVMVLSRRAGSLRSG
jgi:hypothetical protein